MLLRRGVFKSRFLVAWDEALRLRLRGDFTTGVEGGDGEVVPAGDEDGDVSSEGAAPGTAVSNLRRIVEFQWFLIALSVLPGRSLAMNDHWLPYLW